MSDAPVFNIDPQKFHQDPYPALAEMRATAPIAFVPELNATIFTLRDDISECEKNIEVFSSEQPGGLMDELMGKNMMRKDGAAHQAERRMAFPALSPRTVRDQWSEKFREAADRILTDLAPKGRGDLVQDYALLLSGEALKVITGLTNMDPREVDRTSQGMIDGIANYAGDPDIEANCNDCTASIDRHINERIPELQANPDSSLLSVQMQADMPDAAVRANVKLAISGGQNEPRDAIAGAIYALIQNPAQLTQVLDGQVPWRDVFAEYARWISPIGMSPRRIAQTFTYNGVTFTPEERIFFMFGSANHDNAHFENPEDFDITRNNSASIPFGAGPHFCAGAAASRTLIAEVALPMVFDRLPNLRLASHANPEFVGWAFRGLTSLHCEWDC